MAKVFDTLGVDLQHVLTLMDRTDPQWFPQDDTLGAIGRRTCTLPRSRVSRTLDYAGTKMLEMKLGISRRA